MIPALNLGLEGMCTGETRFILSPPHLAYGITPTQFAPYINSQFYNGLRDSQVTISLTLVQHATPEQYVILSSIESGNTIAALNAIKAGGDITLLDPTGNTALMLAIATHNIQVTSLLLNAKPSQMPMSQYVNIAKASGHTALFYAVMEEDPIIVKFLLKKGADPNAALISGDSGKAGWTAMHFASYFKKEEMLQLMLQWGGNPTSETAEGESILEVAKDEFKAYRRKIMNMLNEAIEQQEEEEERIALEVAKATFQNNIDNAEL